MCLARYYLAAYNTAALMPLDQTVHSECQRLWTNFRAAWSKTGEKLTLWRGLYAIRLVCEQAFSPEIVRAAWQRCGIRPDETISPDAVVVARAAELFRCAPPAASLSLRAPESSWLMRRLPGHFSMLLGGVLQGASMFDLQLHVWGATRQWAAR
jgi:hypothetical protein